MSSVTFDGVWKRFGQTVAVEDLSLSINDGEFLVLLGPSGCGKSTALRMIAGLESVSEGTVSIGDRVVNDVDPKDRDIAMVFQSYALYPHMTVRKNIESPLVASRARRVSGEVRAERVKEAAEILGLADYMDRKPGELSGGQRQRVALARAIVRQPEVFLMDEPLSNLDAKLRSQTRAELVALHQRLGTTLVYVTHDQVEAMTMADRIAIISDGKLQQLGPPQEVYKRPQNRFVAEFIGTPPMNCFEGTLDGSFVTCDLGTIDLGPTVVAGERRAVAVGARPEHLRITPDGPLRATVFGIEELGHERHLICVPAGEGSTPTGAPSFVVRQDSSDSSPTVGHPVNLSVGFEDLHLFDQTTGERINSVPIST